MTGPIPDELARQIAEAFTSDEPSAARLGTVLRRIEGTARLLLLLAEEDAIRRGALYALDLEGVLGSLTAEARAALALYEYLHDERVTPHAEPHP